MRRTFADKDFTEDDSPASEESAGFQNLEKMIAESQAARRRHLEEIRSHINALSKVTVSSVNQAIDNLKEQWTLHSIVQRAPWQCVGLSIVAGIILGRLGGDSVKQNISSIAGLKTSFHSKPKTELPQDQHRSPTMLRSAAEACAAEIGAVALSNAFRLLREKLESSNGRTVKPSCPATSAAAGLLDRRRQESQHH